MKTRPKDPQSTHDLPPPPAPTSRDANPWSYGSGGRDAPGRDPHAAPPQPMPHPRPGPRGPRETRPTAPHPRPAQGPRSWLPLVVLAFIFTGALAALAESLVRGDLEAAAGPLIACIFVAAMAWRQVRRTR